MESTRFDHSTKDIPLPSEKDYKRTLIEKTEHLCRRMRWKGFFYLNPSADRSQKETFGFPSRIRLRKYRRCRTLRKGFYI